MVEEYVAAAPQLAKAPDQILELVVCEFQLRLEHGPVPELQEFSDRFPQQWPQLESRLSGLSSTNEGSETDPQAGFSGDPAAAIDEICDRFEAAWKSDPDRPSIADYVQAAAPPLRRTLLKELLRIEIGLRHLRGEQATLEEYRSRFPPGDPIYAAVIADWELHPEEFLLHDRVYYDQMSATVAKPPSVDSVSFGPFTVDGHQRFDHFRFLSEAGSGAFGQVIRAHDEKLDRPVAIKVPKRSRFRGPEDEAAYLEEARMVARMQHPQIVAIYQTGKAPDGTIYLVSQLVEGGTLADLIADRRPDHRTTATLIAQVARALHYAHQNRLIHRDIKPANILIEEDTGRPFVTDFGLAMKEENYLNQAGIHAGSPAYMSPEQARAEGHRLDGRSDVFSLGVLVYEMLAGKRPFRGSTMHETLHQVISVDPRPPRSIDDTIPAELERICLKALSKRASDRYATAELLAEDLEAWLQPASTSPIATKSGVAVVPKGLRSFDAQDADFFLDLLPGIRNRDGLPETIAFWKQKIEETDPEQSFTVGLIYGPSGCGKSSLVKAGLLPHLSKEVIAVYLEATPDETELRILRGLRKRIPSVSDGMPLAQTLRHLRHSHHQKVVIIIDQFEQWLHAHRSEPDAELIQALRQCDGVRIQAIVMIRDDFAMAAARFMQALDVAILQGQNFATVDLFDVGHAANVLIKFGQAFGKLPANSQNLSPEERQFVDDVASGLAQDDKVISVRLSLFAEMVKTKRWTPETLQAVGGTEGIGVNFLEETFSSPQANPRHRLHSVAARAVLKSLLPEIGTDIKGHMRSQQELLDASGYSNRPMSDKALAAGLHGSKDTKTSVASAIPLTANAYFTDLLRILDGELRLITPTDPEGDSPSDSPRLSSLATRFYQLTHDYLVPSLREWLTRKQKETRTGRAELKLEERTAMWTAKPENRHLPSLREWIGIRWLTDRHKWTERQRNIMHKAKRLHLIRTGSLAAILLVAGLT
ncbi:MAG: serine/threonine-protein kinase, partial [Planctomycetaceae bacterium]|nr:serine/threonine-protein kinase [Planctomycetaceae bacterium]